MAALNDKKRAFESQFMNEYWEMRKAFGTPENNQEYWNQVFYGIPNTNIRGTNYLIQKYGIDSNGNENHYIYSMVLNLIHDLEARCNMSKNYAVSLKCFNQMRAASGLPEVEEKKVRQ